MGEDKSLLPFGGFDTLSEYQYNKLSKIFSKVYISSKINKFNFPCNLIYDNTKGISSPMVALNSIFETIKEDKVFVITVDTPLIEQSTIHKLITNSNNTEITIAKDENKIHNLCGVFNLNLLVDKVNYCIKNDIHKINYLIKNSRINCISFSNENQFININTIADYKVANSTIKN